MLYSQKLQGFLGVAKKRVKNDSSKSSDNLGSREAKKTGQAIRHGLLPVLLAGVGMGTKNASTSME